MAFDGFQRVYEKENLAAEAAEIAVLGSIILENDLMRQVKILRVTDFTTPLRRAVFAAMLELEEENSPIDPILIHRIIKRENQDYPVSVITNFCHGLPNLTDIRLYARQIRNVGAKAEAIQRLERLAVSLSESKIELKDFCASLSNLESELRGDYPDETDSFKPLSTILQTEVLPVLETYFKRETSEFLISTGFDEIDKILNGGIYLSDFIAIVAPPKSAKSAFALQLALNIAKNETVGLLSLEMSNLQNGLRFITQQSYADSIRQTESLENAISASWLRPGIYESTFRQASETAASLFDSKLLLCQKPLTWREVQAETRRLVREKNLRVLIVDYWQLVENNRKGQSRAEALGEIAKGLKSLGQELNIAVIALGQFNQEGLKLHRNGGELSALYLEGSGELVKSANVVITLDIQPADINRKGEARDGKMIFKPLRSAEDAELGVWFFGQYLTVEIKPNQLKD